MGYGGWRPLGPPPTAWTAPTQYGQAGAPPSFPVAGTAEPSNFWGAAPPPAAPVQGQPTSVPAAPSQESGEPVAGPATSNKRRHRSGKNEEAQETGNEETPPQAKIARGETFIEE